MGGKLETIYSEARDQRGCRLGFGVVIRLREFVLRLLQEPILTFSLSHSRSYDCPLSSEFLSIQNESQHAVVELDCRVVFSRSDHLIFAVVPNDDFARAIVAFGEGSLE